MRDIRGAEGACRRFMIDGFPATAQQLQHFESQVEPNAHISVFNFELSNSNDEDDDAFAAWPDLLRKKADKKKRGDELMAYLKNSNLLATGDAAELLAAAEARQRAGVSAARWVISSKTCRAVTGAACIESIRGMR